MTDHTDPLTQYPISDWQYEVANGDTALGYSDWVTQQRALDEHRVTVTFTLAQAEALRGAANYSIISAQGSDDLKAAAINIEDALPY